MNIAALYSFTISFICLILYVTSWEIHFTGRQGLFDRFDDKCKGIKKNPWRYNYGKKSLEHNIFELRYSLDVSKGTDAIGYRMSVVKCKSKESPDTCEDFYHFDTKKICNLIGKPGSSWGGLFKTTGNNFTCPLRAGHYDFQDVTFDLSSFPFFPINGLYWRLYQEFYHPVSNEVFTCLTAETTVNFVKN